MVQLKNLKTAFNGIFLYGKALVKWIILSVIVGTLGGSVGSVFHKCIDIATEMRTENGWLLYLLPLGGAVIALLYKLCQKWGKMDTDRVLHAVATEEKVPLMMAPLIFISTVLTHLFGGSAGREGAALQLGGSIGYKIGRICRLDRGDMHMIVISGMSAVFAALFGTPLTAAVFAIEVVSVGALYYSAIVPSLLSALTGFWMAHLFGLHPVHFEGLPIPTFSPEMLAKTVVLAVLCAICSILFCYMMKKTHHLAEKFLPQSILRGTLGGVIIVLLTLIIGSRDYNGAGMDVIERALGGEVRPEAFILKILFTAITIAVGFKGGEIVPAFFIGSTFGCWVAPLLGIAPGFGAAIGFVALFCGAVNCPLASTMLALEVFGAEGILLFAAAAAISYMMSGCFGLYTKQKIVYGKTEAKYMGVYTK